MAALQKRIARSAATPVSFEDMPYYVHPNTRDQLQLFRCVFMPCIYVRWGKHARPRVLERGLAVLFVVIYHTTHMLYTHAIFSPPPLPLSQLQ